MRYFDEMEFDYDVHVAQRDEDHWGWSSEDHEEMNDLLDELGSDEVWNYYHGNDDYADIEDPDDLYS